MIRADTLPQMSLEDRAAPPPGRAELTSLRAGDQRRKRLVALLTDASAGLIPWIVLLAVTLPHRYLAGHWGRPGSASISFSSASSPPRHGWPGAAGRWWWWW
jgi:hypothetical protein